ncbi:ABC transporter ATP-binding protein [Aeromicrobium sp.]|uniref:ABC transporter ATP-binding protein n=1 Tax=Aeromicrobium sp. TaxID=1871063 RepID=UPI0028AAC2B8|nr:ABC transporter ATP-binding protein [Aeromicrobium sp.]
MTTTLTTESLTLGYGDRPVVTDLDLELPTGRITTIVGANACGKSTLLRGMARLLPATSGRVLLDGSDIHGLPTKQVARRLGLLPQSPIAPEGITVAELVAQGRHPHRRAFARWTNAEDAIIADALEATGVIALADRVVDELSGGQRQRVWIALALAQQTEVLLLDEPTTFLDVCHQVEVLDLLTDLNRTRGTTIAMVLHDLNLAARYADHLVAVHHGMIHAQGSAEQVLTQDTVKVVFGLDAQVMTDPTSGRPMILPLGRHHVRSVPASA